VWWRFHQADIREVTHANIEEIVKAITAHGSGKRGWRRHQYGKVDVRRNDPKDDQCAFGNGYMAHARSVRQDLDHYRTVKDLHAEFTKRLPRCELASSGKKAEAERMMDLGANTQPSRQAHDTMMEWKEGIELVACSKSVSGQSEDVSITREKKVERSNWHSGIERIFFAASPMRHPRCPFRRAGRME